ncbi:hypothetical protein [Nocardioides panaciterrulae]|uniref:PH domain-containing protein n=1 Tax=Nocardioides panaciterrulae TaxID=661492 RepID=A0A7Y9E9Z4_9ACTN|nr:hypothetical protein [Nocardioides panaciterrulae]NYD43818.1 hypothetical protein [Nocardioides panaciterrulae]
MSAPTASDYRLAPAMVARLVGTLLVLLAILLFAVTTLAALLHLSLDLVVLVAAAGLVAVFGLGYVLTRRAVVVHLDEQGYRVRLIRGAGVSTAPWTDVNAVAASTARGLDCLVLTLRYGRTTTIPVAAVAADKDDFARDVRQHAERGQGLRPL